MRFWLFTAPGVLLAVAGCFHPLHLTYATSSRWTAVHVAGMLVFPLVGLALAGLVRGRRDPVAVAVVVLSYVFAVTYSALDVISGIAAGYVTHQVGAGLPRPVEVHDLFVVGGAVGRYGVAALLAVAVLLAVDRVRARGTAALPAGLLLVAAAVSFLTSHIYPWRGVLTVLVIGVATGWMAVLEGPSPSSRPDPVTAGGSPRWRRG